MKPERFYAKDRSAWRRWLAVNHARSPSVWLVYDKKGSDGPSLSADDISEEALCFGWIDSLPKKLSETQAMLYVSPRKERRNWSVKNRERAQRMIREGKMRASGLRMIALAKRSGTWTALEEVERSVIPPDLVRELKKRSNAKRYFDAFPPSSKRIILEWIFNAKKPETRAKRIDETVSLADKNLRANHYRQ